MRNKIISSCKEIVSAVFTVIIALIIGAVLIKISGNSPIEAYKTLFQGAFGSRQRMSETFVKAIPLMIMALGTSIAFKSQLWNIGGDGQFIFGALLSILVGLYSGLPACVVMPVSLLFGAIGGGFWSGLAGWLKSKFNANEVITTLMLNYVASYFLSYLVHGPLKDPEGFDFPQTAILDEKYHLPLFSTGIRIHWGIFVAIIILVLMIFFWKSTFGFKVDMIGQGENISQYAGINVKRTVVFTMVLSGALAGIAGWNEVYGVQFRLLDGLASGYGNLSVVIALLGGLNPIGICISSFFFSALMVGGATMQRMTEVPYSVVDIIQGLVIVFIITRTALRFETVRGMFNRRKKEC